MPIRWSIDHTARLIRVLATGEPTAKDFTDMIAAVRAAGTEGYRSIIVSRGLSNVRGKEVAAWAEISAARADTAVSTGQIALVTMSDAGREIADFYIKRLRDRRPCAVFETVEEALAWLGLPPDTPVYPD